MILKTIVVKTFLDKTTCRDVCIKCLEKTVNIKYKIDDIC